MANQTIITGPNTFPTAPVPLLWTRKSPTMITIAIGMTQDVNDVDTTSRPSTALSTEIAGVMMPSP
ncbi:unannotated protein [freshwater metagenome]|uniref:Unannotated protein n=2 Tax=freshwater metagenome TaxID=449393 RepID=A0A6J7EXX8_9ZZZZ